ncbi:unnamed protein product [Allacma fusca]|uniref:G-protein coupled receptors family 1 profile domain-containing protein n=1 Tax=Allacma fusca TaxID=39272 RepID=A0A8J2PDK0_9HEXA|nr:unnamed protein product [Allacma fusca]
MSDSMDRLLLSNVSATTIAGDNFVIGGGRTDSGLFNGSAVGNGTSICTNVTTSNNITFSVTDIANCTVASLFPSSSSESHRLFEFIINGFGITIVAILGIIGNILSAVVLSRPQMRSSVTCLLLGLAFCDSLLVFTSALIFGLFSLSDFMGTLTTYRLVYHPLLVPYLYPISISAQTASVYLTLAVTLERYVAVCHPLRARSLCTWRRARYCVMTVLLFAITYNLPRWWEVLIVEGYNWTYNITMFENSMSEMRANPYYITIYINWAYLVVMYMVPFTGLVAFNLAIYRQAINLIVSFDARIHYVKSRPHLGIARLTANLVQCPTPL